VSFDVPFLTCVWDLEYRSQPYFPELSDGGKWNFREQHFSTLVRRATAVVTGTEVGKQQLRDFFQVPNERILLLPHPTPRDALAYSERPTSSKGAERSTERPIVLYPAQFWPHKNHITLLRAARVLREKHHCNCVVVLTGADYGNQAHVEQTARDLGLGDSVRFEGFVSRERLFDLYRQASIMAYPSTFGPENLPPLEAFALGCPVVASRIPGAEQQLGDAALLVDVYDHEALALAIHRVLTEPALRETLIERGRVRAAKWTSVDFGKAIVQFLDRFAVIRSLWP
jgi:glycosyltransferase involved in cell wall biosynthesis